MINLYTKIHFIICNLRKENGRKLQISGFFLCPIKEHNSDENWSIVPKIKMDLDMIIINL